MADAARQALPARWRSTLEALEAARTEYRRLLTLSAIDASALRRAAKRVLDLEQRRAVLARELRLSTQ